MGFFDRLLDALSSDQPEEEPEEESPVTRSWTNHAGGYYVCSHSGCHKKINESITDHDCCGRCWQGRDCLQTARATYDGPGSFYHRYWESVLSPGVCNTCGEPSDAH